jgi:hypothetical protein
VFIFDWDHGVSLKWGAGGHARSQDEKKPKSDRFPLEAIRFFFDKSNQVTMIGGQGDRSRL